MSGEETIIARQLTIATADTRILTGSLHFHASDLADIQSAAINLGTEKINDPFSSVVTVGQDGGTFQSAATHNFFNDVDVDSIDSTLGAFALGSATTTIDFKHSHIVNLDLAPGITTLDAIGGGIPLIAPAPSVGNTHHIKTITGDSSINITDVAGLLTITSDINLASGGGPGETLIVNGTAPNFTTKTLLAGSNMALTNNGNYITLDAASSTPVTLNTFGTGIPLINPTPQTGTNFYLKSIQAGPGITVTDISGSTLQIDSTAGTVTLGGTGAAQSLVYNSSAPNLQTKDIQAGTNMTFTDNGTYIRLDASGIGSTTTLADYTGGNASIIENGTGPALIVCVFQNSSSITWSNTSTGVVQAQMNTQTTGAGYTSILYSPYQTKEIRGSGSCVVTDNGTYIDIFTP